MSSSRHGHTDGKCVKTRSGGGFSACDELMQAPTGNPYLDWSLLTNRQQVEPTTLNSLKLKTCFQRLEHVMHHRKIRLLLGEQST